MKKTDLAYFAGIFDGEGCITIRARNRAYLATGTIKACGYQQLVIYLGNTNEWICRQLQFSFGGSLYCYKSREKTQQDYWSWCATTRNALAFLEAVLPYLRIKKPQAEVAINFQKQKHYHGRRRLTEEDKAMAEASRILLSNLKKPPSKWGKHD